MTPIIPRWYQTEADRATWDFLCADKRNPVIVLPTGAGKSINIAMACRRAVEEFGGRCLVLAHRKELLEQNAEKISRFVNDVGIYSAGLSTRDTENTVLVAGIQSVHNKAHLLGTRNLVIVDEAHLVPTTGEGMYRTFLADLAKYCSYRVVGYTATPYRLDSGPLCGPKRLFEKVAYSAPLAQLITEGYLCGLTTKPSEVKYDTSKVQVRGGEFAAGQLEDVFSDERLVSQACAEIVARTHDRHSVLVFCSGVHHVERVCTELTSQTREMAGAIVGSTTPLIRSILLNDFRERRLKYLVCCDVLTTGFDAPVIDAIAVLRATLSPGLFAQMVGRGLRTDASKTDCLILDFGSNLARHGCLDDPAYGRKSVGGGADKEHGETTGEAPTKVCPGCEAVVHAAASECEDCGFKFITKPKHDAKPDEDAKPLGGGAPMEWDVLSWRFSRHRKKKNSDDEPKPDTVRVDYTCVPKGSTGGNLNTTTIPEWVCIEHEGFARKKATLWWGEHCTMRYACPKSIDEFLEVTDMLRQPIEITTVKDGYFERVSAKRFAGELSLFDVGDAFEGDEKPENSLATADTNWDDIPF